MTYSQKLRLIKCSKCKKVLPRSKFWSQKGGKPKGECKQCANKVITRWKKNNPAKVKSYSQAWHRRNPGHAHKHKLRYRYGISLEEFNALLASQGGVCAICLRPESKSQHLSVDHCHSTGRNRGLLCDACNRALGSFGDSPETLRRAVDYLGAFV